MEKQSEKKWLAYCVPTNNRANTVKIVLSHIAELYRKYNIDIYYFDSSVNTETRDVVYEYIDNGYHNITYIHFDPEISSDEKLIYILSGAGLKNKYSYIWPVKDRLYFPEPAIKTLMSEKSRAYPAMFIGSVIHNNFFTYPPGEDGIYDDIGKFFYDWGMTATSMDAAIFHYEQLLKTIDWTEFREQFYINDENQFDHFAVLFSQLAKLDNPQVRVFYCDETFPTSIPGIQSSWINEIFHIWLDLWPAVVERLPDCYNHYKEKVIRQTVSLPFLIGSYDMFIKLSQDQRVSPHSFNQYREKLEKYSDIDIELLEPLMQGNAEMTIRKVFHQFNQNFLSLNYEKCHIDFKFNSCLKKYFGEGEYLILKHCFQIYELEVQNRRTGTILTGCKSYYELISKYLTLKDYIRKIALEMEAETYCELPSFIKNHHVSSDFIANMIYAAPFDSDQILSTIERVCF